MFEQFMNEGTPLVVFWVFVGAAVVVQGISKSGFAGGAGILSLPLMMLVMPAAAVPAVLLPLLILCDMNAIYIHRGNRVWRHVLELYLPSIVGILIGAWVWWRIGSAGVRAYEVPLKRFVGVIAVLFVVYLAGKETAMAWVARLKPGVKTGCVAGIAAGFTSTMVHGAGPIVGLYLYAQALGKTLFIGTVAWTFTLINLTKLPFYFAVGLIHRDVLLLDLVLVPLIPLGSFAGKAMSSYVSESLFNRVILVLTLLAAVQLLFNVDAVKLILDMAVRRG